MLSVSVHTPCAHRKVATPRACTSTERCHIPFVGIPLLEFSALLNPPIVEKKAMLETFVIGCKVQI